MFLVNSRFPLASATTPRPPTARVGDPRWLPISQSYGDNLPNSLTTVHPQALVYSTQLPASVSGTGNTTTRLEAFLDSTGSPPSPPQGGYASRLTHNVRRIYQPHGPHAYTPTTNRRRGYHTASPHHLATTHQAPHHTPQKTNNPERLSIRDAAQLVSTRHHKNAAAPVREYQPVSHRLRPTASP